MKKIFIGLAVLVVLAVGASLNYHLVILDDDIKVLRKASLTFSDTVVDARGFNRVKLYTHPALVKAGILDIIN
ncbi:MAG: hypothetical protein ABIL58_00360 [Pseudomonadota bacterium]